MAKKKRSDQTQKEEQRGFRVVDEAGRPVYLPVHPDGVSRSQAETLAADHVIPVRIVEINATLVGSEKA